MRVDADIAADTDLLGKVVSDLQTGISIDNETGEISGTLKYVTGYTGFSGDPAKQQGNFLAIHIAAEGVTGATYTAELIGGHDGPVTLDSDGILIARIESKAQQIKIVAVKGTDTRTRLYDLRKLTLASAANEEKTVAKKTARKR